MGRKCDRLFEANGTRVAAADDDADAFAGGRFAVAPPCSAAKAAAPPGSATTRGRRPTACAAPRENRIVGDEHDAVDIVARDRKLSTRRRARRERVGGDAAGWRIDRTPGFERVRQRRRSVRFDADHCTRPAYHAAMPPISPPPPTATSSVSRSGVCCSSSSASVPCPSSVCTSSNRVHRHGTRFCRVRLTRRQRFGVAFAADREIRAVRSNAFDLRRRRDRGNEDLCAFAEPHRRERHRRAVVAARRGDDAGGGHLALEEIRERPARLERRRALKQFQLQASRGRSTGRRHRLRSRRPVCAGWRLMTGVGVFDAARSIGMSRLPVRVRAVMARPEQPSPARLRVAAIAHGSVGNRESSNAKPLEFSGYRAGDRVAPIDQPTRDQVGERFFERERNRACA